jgi:diguanylate cyclase (GGDEF)-like protein/PAS domain S-box-containing protein
MNINRLSPERPRRSVLFTHRLRQALIEPAGAIRDVGARRSARLIAIMLLLMIALFLVVDGYQLLTVPGYRPPWAGYLFLISAYALSRTALYQVAAVLMIAMFPLVIFTTILASAAPGVDRIVSYLVLSLFLGSIFVSWRGVMLLAAINLAGLLILPMIDPVRIPSYEPLVTPMAENLIGSALVLVSMRHRNQIERDRQAELRGSEERLRLALDAAHMGTWHWDARADVLVGSWQISHLFDLPVEQPVGCMADYLRYLHPADRPEVEAKLAVLQTSDASDYSLDHRIVWADGVVRWLGVTGRIYRDAAGQLTHMTGTAMDITARKRAEIEREQALASLRSSEERYALAARGANDGLWDWDLLSGAIFFSPRWKAMLGYAEDAIGTSPEEWLGRLHPYDQEPVRVRLAAHARRLIDHFELEYRIAHADGSYRYMLCRGLAIGESLNQATRMVGSQTDITDRKQAEERLRYDALHDSLTDLPNRALFMDRLGHAMRTRTRRIDDASFAVLFLDLDRFKTVNDSLGHLIGDELLITVAQQLERCLRPNDTIARLGGDEFTILLDPLRQPQDASEVAERLQQALSAPIQIQGREVFTSVSIGIALGSPAYERPEELLRDADTAMYQAKLRGKARYAVFDAAMHTDALELLQLETDLRRALDRAELRVYYQPIVSLHTEQIVGFEALVRWQHPQRGMIPPDMFIPLAEDTGLITVLGQIVLREACRQLAVWQAQLPALPQLYMSVNLSAKQMAQPDLVELIAETLRETGLAPHQLKLEILESALIGRALAAETLGRLKDLGVQISIDDFGTGYSSLSYLHQFPVDTLKIDRSFISRMGVNGEHSEIILAIVTLARSLGMEAIAEGVETISQRDQLRELQCDYGQGWLFARALDQSAATDLVASLAVQPRAV